MRKDPEYEYDIILDSEEHPFDPIGSFKLAYDPESKFRAIFEDIENVALPANVIENRVKAKGLSLYGELIPENLKKLYWEIRDRVKSTL